MVIRSMRQFKGAYALRTYQATSGRPYDEGIEQPSYVGALTGHCPNQEWHWERCRPRTWHDYLSTWTCATAPSCAVPTLQFRHHHQRLSMSVRVGLVHKPLQRGENHLKSGELQHDSNNCNTRRYDQHCSPRLTTLMLLYFPVLFLSFFPNTNPCVAAPPHDMTRRAAV